MTKEELEKEVKILKRKVEKLRKTNRHKQKVISILRIRTEKGLKKWQIKESRERVNRLAREMEC